MVRLSPINPAVLGRPVGYANGVRVGDLVFLAGQIGARPDGDGGHRIVSEDFAEQFDKALENVLAVIEEAGGTPESLVEMTVYVTDMDAYRASREDVGRVWRRRMGRHFPAMTLVAVEALFEPGALVELRAVASVEEDA
jgi:enamine deaminase RidA (YjgF/YER057c/UK114 family)